MIRIDRPTGVDALEPFVEAGVLGPTEIEVVTTMARVSGETAPTVLLALALAVRGPLLGHVCVDLDSVADTVVVDRSDPDGRSSHLARRRRLAIGRSGQLAHPHGRGRPRPGHRDGAFGR